jgi:hypothetical protein
MIKILLLILLIFLLAAPVIFFGKGKGLQRTVRIPLPNNTTKRGRIFRASILTACIVCFAGLVLAYNYFSKGELTSGDLLRATLIVLIIGMMSLLIPRRN